MDLFWKENFTENNLQGKYEEEARILLITDFQDISMFSHLNLSSMPKLSLPWLSSWFGTTFPSSLFQNIEFYFTV